MTQLVIHPEQVLITEQSTGNTPDTVVQEIAIHLFNSFDKFAILGSVFPLSKNTRLTEKNDKALKKHGVSATALKTQLAKYVDIKRIEKKLTAQFPGFTANPQPNGFDRILTEAIHQFQVKAFLLEKEHDGIIGSSTLDSLGFIFHKGRKRFTPKTNVARIIRRMDEHIKRHAQRSDIPEALKGIDGRNWFDFRVNPSIFGVRGAKGFGFHPFFVLELRRAEKALFKKRESQLFQDFKSAFPSESRIIEKSMDLIFLRNSSLGNLFKSFIQFPGRIPHLLGKSLGIVEDHKDMRDNRANTSTSFHYTGMAMDINYTGNPWIKDTNGLRALRQSARFAISQARSLGLTYPQIFDLVNESRFRTAQQFFEHLKDTKSTPEIFEDLNNLNRAFREHFTDRGTRSLTFGDSADSSVRDPRKGFMNHQKDLVIALRDTIGLAWGTLDFGTTSDGNGDMMHFDLRRIHIGRVYKFARKGSIPDDFESFNFLPAWIKNVSKQLFSFTFWIPKGLALISHLTNLFNGGERNPNKLANKLFFDILHPELNGRKSKLKRNKTFQKEWIAIYNFLVTPFLLSKNIAIKSPGNNLLIPIPGKPAILLKKNNFGLVQFPDSGAGFARYSSNYNDQYTHPTTGISGPHGDNWITAQAGADFFNAIQEFRNTTIGNNITIHYGDISALDPKINLGHKTHNKGKAIDIHYIGSGGKELRGKSAYKDADITIMNEFFRIVQKHRFVKNVSYGKRFKHKGSNNHSQHKDHFHIAQK